MDTFPIELNLTAKMTWLAQQIEKENKWYSTYDYKIKNRKLKPYEAQRINDNRDQCQAKIAEHFDRLEQAIKLSKEQFLNSTQQP